MHTGAELMFTTTRWWMGRHNCSNLLKCV